MIPQLIYIALSLISLGIILAKHGEVKDGKHNFFTSLLLTVLVYWLLYEGGFFNCFLK